MARPVLSARETAGYLEALDNVLLLTHVRPDGDTIGSAAALCCALRDCGRTAYLLPNPEITATYAPYAAPYWAPEGWEAEHIVSVDIADVSLLPENAKPYQERIELAIDHHPSQGFFARNTCLEADSAACGEIVPPECPRRFGRRWTRTPVMRRWPAPWLKAPAYRWTCWASAFRMW